MEEKKDIYYVIDRRRSFTSELETASVLSAEELPFEVRSLTSIDGIENILREPRVKKIIVAQNILEREHVQGNLNAPYYCYLENEDGWKLAKAARMKCYGVMEEPQDLFAVIDREPQEKKPKKEQGVQEAARKTPVKMPAAQRAPRQENRNAGQGQQAAQKNREPAGRANPAKERMERNPAPAYEEPEDKEMDVFESDYDEFSLENNTGGEDRPDYGEGCPEEPYGYGDSREEEAGGDEMDVYWDPWDEQEEEPQHKAPAGKGHAGKDMHAGQERKQAAGERRPRRQEAGESPASRQRGRMKVYEDEEKERELMEDLGRGRKDAKVVTVYSAKGGVGKTTIAAEIATYLALVTRGRGRLRVCIVDYNIDFGDVGTTLALPKKGVNLSYWAEEVREFLKKGKKPEEIVYTREEIEEWLRQDAESGLYILPAPLTNEDSSEISGVELDVILENLKHNGEFDYIVCDTGNNTRNTTMSAIEYADMILMVVDQNINTASCDERFINTMKFLEFDLTKTRMVVNRIMPKRMTTISVEELLEYFPYKCVGKLKFSSDVIKATNIGKPLVLSDPDNEFVKEMKEIVAYILDDDSFREELAKKKGFFARLFKK